MRPTVERFRIVSWLATTLCVAAAVAPARAEAAAGAALSLSPREALVAPGATQRFEVAALAARAPALITWRVVPPSLGAVSQDGLFTAGDAPGRGILRVEARSGDDVLVAHALVRVSRGRGPARLRVLPESPTVHPDGEAAFQAEFPAGVLPDGPVTWTVLPEDAGTIDASGRFRAGSRAGAARILAATTIGGEPLEGRARVWIGPSEMSPPEIVVLPQSTELRPGERVRFETRLRPQLPDSIGALVRWNLFPESLGPIGADGALLAGTVPGEARVVASLPWEGQMLHGTARVRVLPGPGATVLEIDPPSALVAPGRSIGFTARPMGPGKEKALDVQWSVVPSGLGAIGPDGVFHAFDSEAYVGAVLEGDVIARATAGGAPLEARAHVWIAPTAAAELELKPRFFTTSPGADVTVRVFLDEAALPTEVPLVWTLVPPTLGTVTADGVFTASSSVATARADDFGRREGVLVATASLPEGKVARGTARVVIVPPALLPQISVSPPLASISLSEEAAFRIAPPGGAAGPPDRALPPVTWLVRPERLGAIGPSGVFVPNIRFGLAAAFEGLHEVEGLVLAEMRVSPGEVLRGQARLVILLPDAALLALTIDPSQVSIPVVSSQRFVGRLAGRDVRDLPVQTEWRVSPEGIGSITADGFFTPAPADLPAGATRAGTVQLTVTSRTGTTRQAESSLIIVY